MKTTLLCLLLFVSGTVLAQYPKWSLEFSTGFGYDLNGSSPGLESWISSDFEDDGSYVETREYYSYGNGPKASLGMGVEFSKNLGIDANLSYSYGLPSTVTRRGFFFNETTFETGGQSIAFTPMLRIEKEFRYWDDAALYVRFGPHLAGMYTYMDSDYDGSYITRLETSWSFDVGAQAGIGLQIPMSRASFFTVEAQFTHLINRPDRAELTRYEINGEDQLDDLTTSQRERIYVSEINYEPVSEDDPQPYLQVESPFSHYSMNIGIRILLND